jgi:hypothetical protein
VAKAKAKTIKDENKRCVVPPSFAYTGSGSANDAAVTERVQMAGEILGDPLDTAIANAATKSDQGCQKAVQKAYDKLLQTKLKEFGRCKKSALVTATAGTAIANCANAIQAPANSKVQKALTKLNDALTKKCAGVTLTDVFPGNCPAPTQAAFSDCVDQKVECAACVMLALQDDLLLDCDTIDDGSTDFSCTSFCVSGGDCTSGVCTLGVCQAPTCGDGVQNQDETDVDCGGSTCPDCTIGQSCVVGTDCTTGLCVSAACTCGDHLFTFTVNSNTGGAFDSAEWPGGTQQQTDLPGCSATINNPSDNIDLVGILGDHFSVNSYTGYASCFGTGGEDGDGCQPNTCPPLGIGSCEATRPSCSAALNGSGSAKYFVQCND